MSNQTSQGNLSMANDHSISRDHMKRQTYDPNASMAQMSKYPRMDQSGGIPSDRYVPPAQSTPYNPMERSLHAGNHMNIPWYFKCLCSKVKTTLFLSRHMNNRFTMMRSNIFNSQLNHHYH
jgi:hypothetical protein